MTRSPGRLGPGSDCPRSRSAVLGDSGPCPKSRRVDLLSHAYRAIVQGPWGRSDVPCDLAPCPRAGGVKQLSWATRTLVRGPGWSSCPIGCGAMPEVQRGPPPIPGESRSGSCVSSRGDDQLSRVTWAQVRGSALSTSSPRRLGTVNEGPGWRPVFPGDSGPGPTPRGSNICPGRLGSGSDGPRCHPAVPGKSGLCRWARSIDPQSQVTSTLVRGPMESTSPPG